jgi:hypothetical protein
MIKTEQQPRDFHSHHPKDSKTATKTGLLIALEQKGRDYLLWGCFRSSFASSSAPAGCLLQLIHGLDEGARGAKSGCKKSNKHCEGFSIQATLYPDSFRSSLKRAGQSTIDRVDYRHRLPVGFFPVSTSNVTTELHLRRWPRQQLLAADPVK